MDSLYEIVLKKRQDVSQITSNPTLDAIDLAFCEDLDELASSDKFVLGRVKTCIKELHAARGIDYNAHYRTAFEAYNEAVVYYDLRARGATVNSIQETKTPTPDFEVRFTYNNGIGEQVTSKVFVEVKSLGFADGNNEYLRVQKAAFESNLNIEEQRGRGRRVCSSFYSISPLGYKDNGPTSEIEELNKKINNNIKEAQFQYGNGNDSILFVDLSQFMFPFPKEECLPVYPDLLRKYSASGRLWLLAFGKEGDRVFSWPEFEGKSGFDKDLAMPGILICHSYIKGIVFCSGSEKSKRKLFGLYRSSDTDTEVAVFLHHFCDFVNDDINTYGYKYYEALVDELKQLWKENK